MPCINIPSIPPLPGLSGGLSFKPPPLPRPPTSFLCCKLPPVPPRIAMLIAKYEAGLAIPFPPLPAPVQKVLDQLDQARIAINTYKDSLPLACPRSVETALSDASNAAG